jgi:hypothetical protein
MKFSPETLSWSFTTQTMLGWFIETMQWNEETTGGFVISLAINVPQILFAFILPIVTKHLIERKMIVK